MTTETMREAVKGALRQHIKCDATGLAPAVAGVFLVGFEDAADAAIRTVLERLRQPTPVMIKAGREAFLKDMRDRRLLKWIFANNPENHAPIGYVDCPIDLEVQQECADQSTGKSFAAMLDAAAREVG